jgi:cell division protein FtsA
MASHFIVGLDIGTSSIKVVVADAEGKRLHPRLVFKVPSEGIRKGVIVDMAEASQSVNRALLEVKRFSKSALKNVYLTIGTSHVKTQASRGIVAVSRADNEIYQEDLARVMKASQAVNLGPNRMIIHQINREFIVDGVGDIVDPLGLSGNRLEVNSLILDAFTPHVKSVMRIVELAGGQVSGVIFSPIASSRSALTKSQKDLGVLLVDIGAGTTGLSVYEENKLLAVAKFPVGADNISNDLAIGLKIPVAAAESLKLHYGYALAKEVNAKESIDLKEFVPDAKGMVSRRFVGEIIESRLAEIFEFINNELRLINKFGQLPGGAVFVGGGAKLPGLTELARQELKLSSQITVVPKEGWTIETDNLNEYFEDPEYVASLGLILWGADQEHSQLGSMMPSLSVAGIKDFFRYFLP